MKKIIIQLNLVVFGGYNGGGLGSIHFYNLASKLWSVSVKSMPWAVTQIRGAKIMTIDDQLCDLMFANDYNLHVCSGNHSWKVLSMPNIDSDKKFLVVGVNDFIPCGI